MKTTMTFGGAEKKSTKAKMSEKAMRTKALLRQVTERLKRAGVEARLDAVPAARAILPLVYGGSIGRKHGPATGTCRA